MEITIKVEAVELVEAINNLAQAMAAVGIPTGTAAAAEVLPLPDTAAEDKAAEQARKLAEMDADAEKKKAAVLERKRAAAAKKEAAEAAKKKAAEEAAAAVAAEGEDDEDEDEDEEDLLADEPKPNKSSYSKEDVRGMLADFSSRNADGTKRMKAELKKLGAKKFSEVPESDYPALLEALELV